MKKVILVLFISMVGCTPPQSLKTEPLGYSYLPNYQTLDSIIPILPQLLDEVIDTSALEHFPPILLDSNEVTPKDGILISSRMSAYYTFYRSGYKRLEKESEIKDYLMKSYYDKAKEAEVLYQKRIAELEEQNKRSWLEKNLGYIGFTAGLVTAILFEFAQRD